MTTESEHNTNTTTAETSLQVDAASSKTTTTTTTTTMDADKVSAAMGDYMLKGWVMLNDGCPDCNTPLMRNREATSQICVHCQLNPPVDPEDVPAKPESPLPPPAQATQPLPPPPTMPLSSPPPTAALPAPPRPVSPQNHRVSVLDPAMEARKGLRPLSHRNSNSTLPAPPSTPPPTRSNSKPMSGPLAGKVIPRPPGPPPTLPLSPPPTMSPPPQPIPRDMKRSPQSSIILSGSIILPPSTPPPPPPAVMTSGPILLPPPPAVMTSGPILLPPAPAPERSDEGANMNTGEQELSSSIQTPPPPQVNAVIDDNIKVEVGRPTSQILSEPAPVSTEKVLVEGEAVHPVQVSTPKSESGSVTFPEPAQEHGSGSPGSSPTISDGHARQHALGADEDEKAAESDDDFEDAEEEMSKPTDEEVKERESRREQSERASRLIGQKMLQGWTMLQDLCPNPSCHEVLLLRNREKKEYCVICENYFQREQDLEHGKYTIVSATNDNSASTTSPASTTPQGQPGTTSPAPVVPESLSPPPQGPSGQPLQLSPAIPPQFSSPRLKSVTSPIASPSFGRNQRELLGRVSNPILLPPVTTSMTSQQVLSKHMSEDLDRLASEDEEARKHINMIRKVGEYTSRTLPPVPMAPPPPRPMSTYSNSSDSDRHEGKLSRHASSHRHGSGLTSQQGSSAQLVEGNPSTPPPPPPPPLSPEVQALVAATHKTIATILVKLEACRSALEVADSPKECQVLTNQIKSLMECLKACREAL